MVFSSLNDSIKYYPGLITQLGCFKAAWGQAHLPTHEAMVGAQSTMGARARRNHSTQAQVKLCKGTGMPSGTDVLAEMSAVGDRDIWKRSFHSSENKATWHAEELTLEVLQERPKLPYCRGWDV